MGGAILFIKAKTQEELNLQLDETIQQAEHKGLVDLRGIQFFEPGKCVELDGNPEDQWVAVILVHS